MRIIRAIVDGGRTPRTLAAFRDDRCKSNQKKLDNIDSQRVI